MSNNRKSVSKTINKKGISAVLKGNNVFNYGKKKEIGFNKTKHKDSGMPGTSRYISTKNKKNKPISKRFYIPEEDKWISLKKMLPSDLSMTFKNY